MVSVMMTKVAMTMMMSTERINYDCWLYDRCCYWSKGCSDSWNMILCNNTHRLLDNPKLVNFWSLLSCCSLCSHSHLLLRLLIILRLTLILRLRILDLRILWLTILGLTILWLTILRLRVLSLGIDRLGIDWLTVIRYWLVINNLRSLANDHSNWLTSDYIYFYAIMVVVMVAMMSTSMEVDIHIHFNYIISTLKNSQF